MAEYAAAAGDDALFRASLEGAAKRGLPDESTQWLASLQGGFKKERDQHRLWQLGVGTLVAWIVCFVALFAIGSWLSQATLDAADRSLENPRGEAEGVDALLRGSYRFLLQASGVFFYVSMPLMFVLVLAIGGGLLYAMLRVGHIPAKLFLLVAVVTLTTAFAIMRGLFVRARDEDPGVVLDLDAQPRFRDALQRVADHVGTRCVDTVFVTPDTSVAVYERGGMRTQLQGKAERCLIVGIGVLEGMTVRQLKAILAHEYGHFSNRDTAGGGFALSVRRSLMHVAIGIAQAGSAGWYNPAWLFLKAFHNVFMRISQGASRLQEVLADRWAASTYGSLAFERGLQHVVATSVRFENRADEALNRALRERTPLTNLYRLDAPPTVALEHKITEEIRQALEREPTEFDSHPSPSQRFTWVRGYAATGVPPEADDDSPAWSLFEGRDELEHAMTARVRQNIENDHGVQFVAQSSSPEPVGPAATE